MKAFKNKFMNNNGMSLVELMVALGISSMVSLAVMRIQENATKTLNRAVTDSDFKVFVSALLRASFSKSSVCTYNFNAARVRFPDGVNPESVDTGDGNFINLYRLRDPNDTGTAEVLMSTDTGVAQNLVAGNSWRVLSIEMLPFVPDTADADSNFTGTCPVEMSFERARTYSYGAKVKRLSMNMKCQLTKPDLAGGDENLAVISSCILQEAAREGFWQKYFSNNVAFINYEEQPGGFVTVGPVARRSWDGATVTDDKPAAPLEVYPNVSTWYFPLFQKAVGIPKDSIYGFSGLDSLWGITETGSTVANSCLYFQNFDSVGGSIKSNVTHCKNENTFSVNTKVLTGDIVVPNGRLIIGEDNDIFGVNNTIVGRENKIGQSGEDRHNIMVVGTENEITENNSFTIGNNNITKIEGAFDTNAPDDVATGYAFIFGKANQALAPFNFIMGETNLSYVIDSFIFGQNNRTNDSATVMSSDFYPLYDSSTNYTNEEYAVFGERLFRCIEDCPSGGPDPAPGSARWKQVSGHYIFGEGNRLPHDLKVLGGFALGYNNSTRASTSNPFIIGSNIATTDTDIETLTMGIADPSFNFQDLNRSHVAITARDFVRFDVSDHTENQPNFYNMIELSSPDDENKGLKLASTDNTEVAFGGVAVSASNSSVKSYGGAVIGGHNNRITEDLNENPWVAILGGINNTLDAFSVSAADRGGIVQVGGYQNTVNADQHFVQLAGVGNNINMDGGGSVSLFSRELNISSPSSATSKGLVGSAFVGGYQNTVTVLGGVASRNLMQFNSRSLNWNINDDNDHGILSFGGFTSNLAGGNSTQVTFGGSNLNLGNDAKGVSVINSRNNNINADGRIHSLNTVDLNQNGGSYNGAVNIANLNLNNVQGSLVFGDYTSDTLNLEGGTGPSQVRNNAFSARFNGGYEFTANGYTVTVSAGGNTMSSDRNLKHNISRVVGEEFLSKLSKLRVYKYHYIGSDDVLNMDGDRVSYLGPIAEDFYDFFKTGRRRVSIGELDLAGVGLAATQSLIKRMDAIEAKLKEEHSFVEYAQAYLEVVKEKLVSFKNWFIQRDEKVYQLKRSVAQLEKKNSENREILCSLKPESKVCSR